ncbi:MAG: DUF6051 family protein [Chloroflexota bacterium]
MRYSEGNNLFKTAFSPEKKEIMIPGSRARILNLSFCSEEPEMEFQNSHDLSFTENMSFSYPVFLPANKQSRKVMLLLHGLNERSWLKYLTWGNYLCENTDSYVILFPISFHINRSPGSWKDPRVMSQEVQNRVSLAHNVQMASFANVALSKRLTDDPRRFFFSGYRTAADITRLFDSIRKGNHEVIPATSEFNIFSYSIGAFLAEILMMTNPAGLFSQSKLFMLCGGSVFSRMHGTSKLIMDSLAFRTIFCYYMEEFEETLKQRNSLSGFFRSNRLGMVFRSMIDTGRLKIFREKIISEMRERICAITLLKDLVIPPAGIVETLDCFNTGRVVEVADFPYDYSHENPFPVFGNALISRKVDDCFERVMSKAAEFFV